MYKTEVAYTQAPAGLSEAGIQRLGQVNEEVTGLEINAKDLAEIVGRLTNKLAPITAPQPSDKGQTAAPLPVLVPLASKLRDVCSDVRQSVDRLRELCANVELSE